MKITKIGWKNNHVHPNLCNATFYNVAPSLISQNAREHVCLV